MINNASVAAATAVVGYDILQDVKWKRENYNRVLIGIGFGGSAAVGDTALDLFINGIKVGEFVNLVLLWPSKDYILPTRIPVPANALMECKVTDGATTNPINVVALFKP